MLENSLSFSIPEEWLDGDKNDYSVLTVASNGYSPYFGEGDILIICKDISRVEENDIVLCKIDDALELHKQYTTDNGTQIFESLNPYEPPHINIGQTVIGFLYMRITNYRQGAAEYGKNATD